MEGGDREELTAALEELRDEFREFRETTEQYEREKRVENIQVLIALGVVGGAITILTSRLVNTPFWQDILASPYWKTILVAFVGASGLFLILKLLTIPLREISRNRYLIYIHDVLEPFLYFFAVTGVLLAIFVRVIIWPVHPGLLDSAKIAVAVLSLILPFILGVIYAQAYRFNAALRRSRGFITEVNRALEDSVRRGILSSKERTSILRGLLVASMPSPLITYVFFILWQAISDHLNKEGPGASSESELNEYIEDYLTTSSGTPITYSMILEIFRYISETPSNERKLSEEERNALQNRIRDLRNQAAHGELDHEDLEKFIETLEEYSRNERNN